VKRQRVRVPGSTSNLGPGFDCLGVAVDLYLTVECQPADRFVLELAGEGADRLPTDASNLLVQALLAGAGLERPPQVAIASHNDIPLARGLGSSSAAIIAGLALGHLLAGLPLQALDRQRLLGEALRFEGHPDNLAPGILGDLVVSSIENDKVLALKSRWPEDLRLVAVIPALEISTAAARAALPHQIAFEDAVVNTGRLARLMASIQSGRYDYLAGCLEDRLHEPYRLPLATGLTEVLAGLRTHPGSLGAYLSGSGPTLMGLGREADVEALGTAAVETFATLGVDAHHRVLTVDRNGLDCKEWTA
jgi:homoserine kinase